LKEKPEQGEKSKNKNRAERSFRRTATALFFGMKFFGSLPAYFAKKQRAGMRVLRFLGG
jgi:hypothetical protein